MILPALKQGKIIDRYKRFFADVDCDGEIITAHCPNTGAMTSCWEPGRPAQISYSDNPKRKLPWTLERVDMGQGWVGINTNRVNAIVAEGIDQGRLPELGPFEKLRREPVFETPTHGKSRFDIALDRADGKPVYVEIKNTTLLVDDTVQFPDAVSSRALKHLELLETALESGAGACLVFAVNRPETLRFEPAAAIHPEYAEALAHAANQGVLVLVARLKHTADAIELDKAVRWMP